jgi:hypothetical protein
VAVRVRVRAGVAAVQMRSGMRVLVDQRAMAVAQTAEGLVDAVHRPSG